MAIRVRERDLSNLAAPRASWLLDARGGARREAAPPRGVQASLRARAASLFARVFLPEGFPGSVRDEYLRYQAWDTLQALCSYLRGILTTTALLEASGVGNEAASPLAAALAWVMRDGFGMLGSLLFACCVGGRFDGNVKEWRLFADLINDVGLSLDMAAPLLPGRFLLVTSCGAMCKTMCGVAAAATRASITAHFALADNLADVSAKEGAQETAVSLAGLLLGVGLARHAHLPPSSARLLFALLTGLHVLANYRGVRCLRLCSLNCQRAALLLDAVVRDGGRGADRASVAARERVLPTLLRRAPVRLGARLCEVFAGPLAGAAFAAAAEACAGERHLLWPCGTQVRALLADGATQLDTLRAFAHARLLLDAREVAHGAPRWPPVASAADVRARGADVRRARAELDGAFKALREAMARHGWSGLRVHLDAGPCRYSWDEA